MEFKINKGIVLVEPIAATDTVSGFSVSGSRKLPANKARVLNVGEADEFGKPMWKPGDIIVIPSAGVTSFDYEGRQLKLIHHRRIMIGYEDQA